MLFLSETWLDDTVSDLEVEFAGFNIYRLDRETKVGGGVCVFVKQDFKVDRLYDLSAIAESGLHILWLKIQIRNLKSFLICTVYRPPNTSINCLDNELSIRLVEALYLNKPIFILGDLNCNMLNANDPLFQALTTFCLAFNLSQLVHQPTRVTETSKSLLDILLVSNKNLVIETKVIPVSISDHDLIYATLKLKKERSKPVYVPVRSFKHYDTEAFLKDMFQVPWPVIDTFDNVEDSLDAFNLLFNEVLDNHAPIRNIKVRNRPCPFMTEKIRSLMKIRDKWRKLARKTNDPLHWSGYKTRKREVKRELRLAEREFVADQIKNNPNNARCLWKTIRSCIPNKSACRRSFTKDDILVANEFNTFFSSIGQTTIEKVKLLADECKYDLTKSIFTPRIYAESEQFVLQMVESKQVHDIINSMPTNKSPGIDKISMRVIKDSLPAILPTITSIFNASLTSGVFPSAWKMAEITPIPKEGDHEQANNNRPISLLPMLSKVCEKVVLNKIVSYLDINKRLSTEQSGNKKYHSTETSLIETTDTFLHAIDKKEVTAVVLLDMSKAFDSLDHKILMLKLQDVGMSPGALNWFSSYLSNRQQVVRINSALSRKLTVHSGVPRGSILGPILFTQQN